MIRSRTLFTLLIPLVGLILLLVLALPVRRERHGDFGLPGFLRARSAASFLLARGPGEGDPALLERAVRAGNRVEDAWVQLAFDSPSAGHLARSAARLMRPDLVVPKREPLAASRPLTLLPVDALGERGPELMRLSSENLARWPEAARLALAGLIETQNGISRLLLRQIRARGGRRVHSQAAARWLGRIRSGSPNTENTGDSEGNDSELTALLEGFDPELVLELLIDLADRLDWFVQILEQQLTPAVIRSMKSLPSGDGVPRDLLVLARIEAGLVIIGGVHTTILPQNGVALTIDLGGDDRWAGGVAIHDSAFPEPLTRVCVDLNGNDRYQGRGGQLAGGVLGLSLLIDRKGDDTYESDGLEFGAALFGAGLLIDRGGRDSYRCRAGGLGFGLGGLGLLFDGGEDDRYQTGSAGMGCGVAGGAGVLVDHWGDELYLALGGGEADGAGGSGSSVLGAGVALWPGLPAGLGLLLDRRGADVYRAGRRSLGFAEGGGLGCLLDGGGDDLYSAEDESLGVGAEGGFGYLRDLGGDDEYLSRGRSQGFGAAAVGLFIDDQGSDRFLCLSPSQGVGLRGGAGLHADMVGR